MYKYRDSTTVHNIFVCVVGPNHASHFLFPFGKSLPHEPLHYKTMATSSFCKQLSRRFDGFTAKASYEDVLR